MLRFPGGAVPDLHPANPDIRTLLLQSRVKVIGHIRSNRLKVHGGPEDCRGMTDIQWLLTMALGACNGRPDEM